MMEVKKTIKYDGKLKGIRVINDNIVDADGEIIDLVSVLSKVYGEKSFDLSTTTKEEEIIDVDNAEEAYVDDDGNLIYE